MYAVKSEKGLLYASDLEYKTEEKAFDMEKKKELNVKEVYPSKNGYYWKKKDFGNEYKNQGNHLIDHAEN